jgi:hypothetical protein
MKKQALLLGLLFCFAVSAFSQMGITGGLNLSWLRTANDETPPNEMKCKAGFHIGGFYDIHLFDNFYLYPQFLFSLNPTEKTYKSPVVDLTTSYKTNGFYVTSPVMLSYKIPVNRTDNIGIDWGAYLSCGLLGNLDTYRVEEGVHESDSEPLFPDNGERLEIGLIGGARYESAHLVFSGHLMYGLNTVNYWGDKTILFMLSVGYKLRR